MTEEEFYLLGIQFKDDPEMLKIIQTTREALKTLNIILAKNEGKLTDSDKKDLDIIIHVLNTIGLNPVRKGNKKPTIEQEAELIEIFSYLFGLARRIGKKFSESNLAEEVYKISRAFVSALNKA